MTASIVTDHPLASGCPPRWASQWGEDEYGPWCRFDIGDANQTLRWIPPGQFLMGSPDNEESRNANEGPQHRVTICRDFWLFDTPCTQALWQAVTAKKSLSRFGGQNHPVENVSLPECMEFMQYLNKRMPGLNLRLPTEAEWEYSCRAGNADVRYGALTEIAWFSTNSKSQTHDVKSKQPNDWGLHDMLGNVWEWCEDSWMRPYSKKSQSDPLFTHTGDGIRVIRGGSWRNAAQYVRAAFRYKPKSKDRHDNLGFRCLSSAEPSQ